MISHGNYRRNATGRRLGRLLVGYLAIVVAAITLAPLKFAVPERFHAYVIVAEGAWISDVLLNFVLFLPFGFILRRHPRLASRSLAILALIGVGGSALIEFAQLFEATRFSAASDLLSNAAGCWLGALLSDQFLRGPGDEQAAIGRLLLDLPLTAGVYLLWPLLWLDGLVTPLGVNRSWLLLPIAIVGAVIIAAVLESGGSSAQRRAPAVVITVLAWFGIGAVPALRTSVRTVSIGFIAVAVAALVAERFWRARLEVERRLEPQVVRLVLPIFVLYVVGASLIPTPADVPSSRDATRLVILLWLERAAAFTMLGYLLAEWRGRREEPWPRAMFAPAVMSGSIAALLLVIGQSQSYALPAAAIGAACIGATLYDYQRAHVLALLQRTPR